MATLQGNKTDTVPFTIYEWILSNASAPDGLKALGLIPIGSAGTFTEAREGFTTEYEHIVEDGHKRIRATVKTPVGELTQVVGRDPTFGTNWNHEFFIKQPEDYPIMEYVFEHCTFSPDFDKYVEANNKMGESGIVVSEVMQMPLITLEAAIMGPVAWSEGLMLYPDDFKRLHDTLSKNHRRMIDIVAQSPAEVVWLPDNITGIMVSPDVFTEYCTPAYEYACSVLHDSEKLCFSHFDGANATLKDCIAATDIDIIEAFTPPPMETMTVADARQAWPDKVLSLNFPGNVVREDDAAIKTWTNQYMDEGGTDGKFIIGCTEEFDFTHFDRAFTAIALAMRGGDS